MCRLPIAGRSPHAGGYSGCHGSSGITQLAAGEAPFDLWLDKVECIGEGQLHAIIDEIPAEWTTTAEEKRPARLFNNRRHKLQLMLAL
ncbi:MAG TPA: hypothetical protein DER60_07175 [Syntrophomonas sp.]|jgi:hypothetical protein|nr:hypothetical protein [Syntrophomonas sp.]